MIKFLEDAKNVECFAIWDHLSHYKTKTLVEKHYFSWRLQGGLQLPKYYGPPKLIKIVPNPKQGTYSGCFGFFFSSYLKARLFPDYNRRSKHHWYFPFTPIPTSPKIPYFFNTFLFWVSCNMQHATKEKEAVLLLNFQLINKKKQSDYTRVLVVINCELKMHGKFFNFPINSKNQISGPFLFCPFSLFWGQFSSPEIWLCNAQHHMSP